MALSPDIAHAGRVRNFPTPSSRVRLTGPSRHTWSRFGRVGTSGPRARRRSPCAAVAISSGGRGHSGGIQPFFIEPTKPISQLKNCVEDEHGRQPPFCRSAPNAYLLFALACTLISLNRDACWLGDVELPVNSSPQRTHSSPSSLVIVRADPRILVIFRPQRARLPEPLWPFASMLRCGFG